MPSVVEGMLLGRLVRVDPVTGELLRSERDRTSDRLSGVRVLLRSLALAVLDVGDLMLGPDFLELVEDATVIGEIAVLVVEPLPGDDGGEVRRAPGGDRPLV